MKREAEQLGTTVDALQRELRAERPRVDVILMAHGSQERLAELEHPKQLLELPGGETILERTIRLLSELALCKVGICAPPAIAEAAMGFRQDIMMRNGPSAAGAPLIANMHASAFRPAPDHEQLFLLADVVWSPADLWTLVHDHHPAPIFYGRHENPYTSKRHGEIFALRSSPALLAPFVDCATLWELHHCIGGTTPFRTMHGYTDDVDTPEDLAERLPLLRSFVQKEVPP